MGAAIAESVDACENWSLTLKEEQRLRVYENRVLKQQLTIRQCQKQEAEENCMMRHFMIGIPHQILPNITTVIKSQCM